jgi:hypothetical protein
MALSAANVRRLLEYRSCVIVGAIEVEVVTNAGLEAPESKIPIS